MPLSVTDFKAAFSHLLKASEERATTDTRPVESTTAVDAMRAVLEAWKAHGVDGWPDGPKSVLEGLRDALANADKPAKARALAETIVGRIGSYAGAKAMAAELRSSAHLRSDERDFITEAFPPKDQRTTAQAQRYEEMKTEGKAIQTAFKEAKQLEDAGDWLQVVPVYREIAKRLRILHGQATAEKWSANATVLLNQGAFTRPDDVDGLLDSVGSEGVCQALVLDFLGRGGSGNTAGSPQKGQITSQHLKLQAAYSVQQPLDKAFKQQLHGITAAAEERQVRAGVTLDTKEKALRENITAVEEAEAAAKRWEAAAKNAQPNIDRFTTIASWREGELSRIRKDVPVKHPARAEMEKSVTEALDKATTLREQWTAYAEKCTKSAEAWRQHGAKLLQQRPALEQDKSEALTTATELQKETIRLQGEEGRLAQEVKDLAQRSKGISGAPLPSQVLDTYGVTPDPDTQNVKTAASGKVLTAGEVSAAIGEGLGALPPGKPAQLHVTVKMAAGGHAIGIQATIPPDGESTPKLDIEFFDPNAGAFRFADIPAFRTFLEDFYTRIYPKGWTTLSTVVVSASGTRDVDEQDSLLGPDVETAWNADWPTVLETRRVFLAEPRLPNAVREEAEAAFTKIASVFPVSDPSLATQVDLRVGQLYVGRYLALVATLTEKLRYVLGIWAELLDGVEDFDEATETLATEVAQAVDGGDLSTAETKIKAARKALAKARKTKAEAKPSSGGGSSYQPPPGIRQDVPSDWEEDKVDTNALFGSMLDVHASLFGGNKPTDLPGVTFAIVSTMEIGAEYVRAQVWDEANDGKFSPETNKAHAEMARDMAPAAVTIVPGKDPKRTVYFNKEYFERNGGKPNYDEVNAVMLHESHHAASSGFVNTLFFADDHGLSWKLDECFTDYFTKKAWDAKYPDKKDDYLKYTSYFKNAQRKTGWFGDIAASMVGNVASEAEWAAAYFKGDPTALGVLKGEAQAIKKALG